jgi:RimJ/RimL family protein N-acetyltransferase
MRYIAFGRPFDEKEVELCRQALLKAAEPTGFGTWVAQLHNNNPSSSGGNQKQLVGWWVLSPSETNPSRAEFGLRVVRQFWGQGFAKEGTLALLRYAFESMPGLGDVYGETMTVNKGSCKTMASCGMKLVRKFFNEYKDFTPAPGIEHGEVEYSITREEWEAQAQNQAREQEHATRQGKLQPKQFDSGEHMRIPAPIHMVSVGSSSAPVLI